MVDFNERIATLEDRLKQLKAKQHRVDTRRRTLESRKNRKEDTRRKILVGAVIRKGGARRIPRAPVAQVAVRVPDAPRRPRAVRIAAETLDTTAACTGEPHKP